MSDARDVRGHMAAGRDGARGWRIATAVAGLWLLCFIGSYAALRVLDEAVTVPGAHAGIDLVLAFFTSLPIAALTGTSITMFGQLARGTARPPRLAGGRAVALALTGLLVEAAGVLEIVLAGTGIGPWLVLPGWLAVMAGGGTCLPQLLFGFE